MKAYNELKATLCSEPIVAYPNRKTDPTHLLGMQAQEVKNQLAEWEQFWSKQMKKEEIMQLHMLANSWQNMKGTKLHFW